MILHLSCRGHGIGLALPAAPNIVASRLSTLREGLKKTTPVHISGVTCQMTTILPYIQHADLEDEADLQRLNILAERISEMALEEQKLFSGALELEHADGLGDVVRIVTNLDRYEIFSKIKTDEDLGRFLVDTSFITGKLLFPKETWPYLDYAKIGMEQRDTLGGIYTPHGLVRRREEAPVQTDTSRTMLLTLAVSEQSHSLALPVSADQLEHTKWALGLETFSQAKITSIEYTAPYLDRLIPMDGITVEGANKMALCLQLLKADDEIMKYYAALEAEKPSTFSRALDMGMDIDNRRAYGRESLRRIGADEELLGVIAIAHSDRPLRDALFTPEQLVEIYHGCTEILTEPSPITDERRECLQSIIEQVERIVPDLDRHIQKEQEPAAVKLSASVDMRFG